MPQTSVIIVTRDKKPEALADCINSFHKQTIFPLEIIVVHSRLQGEVTATLDFPVIHISQNSVGIGNARNTGVATAKGNIIAFTDDDAIPHQDWIEKIELAFQNHPELSYIGGDFVAQPKNAYQKWTNSRSHSVYNTPPTRAVHAVGNNMSYRAEIFEYVKWDENAVNFDEPEIQNTLFNLGLKGANFPDILIDHMHKDNLRSLTKTQIGYTQGCVQYFQVKRRELFNFEDLLNLLFFTSLFYVLTFSIIPVMISMILFSLIVIRFAFLYENRTSIGLLATDIYISFVRTLAKIYYSFKYKLGRNKQ